MQAQAVKGRLSVHLGKAGLPEELNDAAVTEHAVGASEQPPESHRRTKASGVPRVLPDLCKLPSCVPSGAEQGARSIFEANTSQLPLKPTLVNFL